jgi:acetylornithine deacetylase/succinyl-diaminopimelate desuccinylase-like protein
MRWGLCLLCASLAGAQTGIPLGERALKYLTDLVRIDTTNPPGGETAVAEYLKREAEKEGIACELLGDDPSRLNFIARLPGRGEARPLLLMAHSDVVPADRSQWTVDPFAGELRDSFLYGRGAQDDKGLLAAELAVMVELKRRGTPLKRDVILLAEADEEAGSTGIQWLIEHAWPKIDAEFAVNEGGFAMDTPSGRRIFNIQTAEKIPSRVVLRASGTAGHGSLPRPDNPVVRVARAVAKLADAEQPVRMNATTRRYISALGKLEDYRWLAPLAPRLEARQQAAATASLIREREPELAALLQTTVSPTMLEAGTKINVIPNVAEAQIDVRRLPNETREEVVARFRRIINDPAVEIRPAAGQEMPATEPSSMTTTLYAAMEEVFTAASPGAVVIPYMTRGATDGAFLRKKGMAVYGAPIFLREDRQSRAHGNDERISVGNLNQGAELLWKIVTRVVE